MVLRLSDRPPLPRSLLLELQRQLPKPKFSFLYFFPCSFSSQQDSFCSDWLPVTPWALPSKRSCSWRSFSLLFDTYRCIPLNTKLAETKTGLSPPAIDTRIYVDWALENRFQVGDTARDQFKHKEIRDLPLPSISWVFIIFFC